MRFRLRVGLGKVEQLRLPSAHTEKAITRKPALAILNEPFSHHFQACGIVGMPNVGKSTLFNALTRTQNAEASNFPFCTSESATVFPHLSHFDDSQFLGSHCAS